MLRGCGSLPRNALPPNLAANAAIPEMPDIRAWAGRPSPAMEHDMLKSFGQEFMVMHGDMLSFALRSLGELPTERHAVVKLHFPLPSVARAIGAVSLRSRQPSPLAQQLVARIQRQAAVS